MKSEILKYKHYFIILSTLLLLNYITVPLWEYIEEQKQENRLLSKRLMKTEMLISNAPSFDEELSGLALELDAIYPYLFRQVNESKFKLAAQQKLEELLAGSGCTVQRVGWKGSVPISDDLTRWNMEARYKGNPACMIKATRALGSSKPLIRVRDFNFSARKIDGKVGNRINAVIELVVLHKPAPVNKN